MAFQPWTKAAWRCAESVAIQAPSFTHLTALSAKETYNEGAGRTQHNAGARSRSAIRRWRDQTRWGNLKTRTGLTPRTAFANQGVVSQRGRMRGPTGALGSIV
eukprot:5390353-Amphidinium_carterae.1